MKIHYKKIEFFIVFLFLVLPPVFVTSVQNTSYTFSFSYYIFFQAAIAFLLDFQQRKNTVKKKSVKLSKRINTFSQGTVTLGLLFLVFALFQAAVYFFPQIQKDGISTLVLPPSGFSEYLICIINVIISAYYEEVLYRQYLPLSIYDFFTEDRKLSFIIEIFPVLFFAASHLYLGWLGVLNALFCGIILRRCAYKTDSIYTGTVVHIIYNLCMFLVIA